MQEGIDHRELTTSDIWSNRNALCPECAVTYVAAHIFKIQCIIIKYVAFYANRKLMKLIRSEHTSLSMYLFSHFFGTTNQEKYHLPGES